MSRKGFHYTSNRTKILSNFKIIGAAGGRAGPLLCMLPGGRSLKWWNFTDPILRLSLSPRSYSLHTCAHSNSINSTPSMLPLTQVWTNSSVRCAFPVLPSWCSVNILSRCQTKCVRNVKRSYSWTDPMILLHLCIRNLLASSNTIYLALNKIFLDIVEQPNNQIFQ